MDQGIRTLHPHPISRLVISYLQGFVSSLVTLFWWFGVVVWGFEPMALVEGKREA